MNIILIDHPTVWKQLLPLTYTRPVSACRTGIVTIAEKWQMWFPESTISTVSKDYLQDIFPAHYEQSNLYISSDLLPNKELVSAIRDLKQGECLNSENGQLLALKTKDTYTSLSWENLSFEGLTYAGKLERIAYPWHLFQLNASEIKADIEFLGGGKQINPLDFPYATILNPEQVYVEEGVKIYPSILNAEKGPIYLGKSVEVQEGAAIRGSFAAGEGSVINMGSKVRGDSTIGPYCKIGGEVSNSILFGYSNKGHDGFLGNSILGEWCNLGADTNTSNLKNNYGSIKLYSYADQDYHDSGLQFCGTIMGDHSKTAINTQLNTGTMVGVGANIFHTGFPPKYIPSFSWGGVGDQQYEFDKFLEVAEKVMCRRGVALTPEIIAMLKINHTT